MARSIAGLSNQKYPKFLAELQRAEDFEENHQWRLGDISLAEFGMPPGPGEKDLGLERMREALTEAEEIGVIDEGSRYTLPYLKMLRETAAAFSPSERKSELSFTTHQEAGSPQVLAEIIREAKRRGIKVTRLFVRTLRRAKHRALDLQHETLHRAVTVGGKPSASVNVPPRPVQNAPMDTGEIGVLFEAASLLELAREANRQVDLFKRAFEKTDLESVQREFVDVALRDTMQAIRTLQGVADQLTPYASPRARLTVV